MKKRLEMTEKWFSKQMLRISWIELVSKEEVLMKTETTRNFHESRKRGGNQNFIDSHKFSIHFVLDI